MDCISQSGSGFEATDHQDLSRRPVPVCHHREYDTSRDEGRKADPRKPVDSYFPVWVADRRPVRQNVDGYKPERCQESERPGDSADTLITATERPEEKAHRAQCAEGSDRVEYQRQAPPLAYVVQIMEHGER